MHLSALVMKLVAGLCRRWATVIFALAAIGGAVQAIQPRDRPHDLNNFPIASQVPAVFRNGAWDSDHPGGALNPYVAGLLSKDVYFKLISYPRASIAARRNFTLFATLFCRSMARLGADNCEPVAGSESLVWALVRAGRSVIVVVRGSNTPQNWIADVKSLRMINVGDFGGGDSGANVAAGFYKIFAANRRAIVDRIRGALEKANAAASAGAAEADDGEREGARLWVFGHSLGGAVALMVASYLDVREGLTATGVYTFGCPRVGDAAWARSYRLHDVTLRLENAGDIVPALPLGPSWRHVGAAVAIRDCGGAAEAAVAGAVVGPGGRQLDRGATALDDEAGRAASVAARGVRGGHDSKVTAATAEARLRWRRGVRHLSELRGENGVGGGGGDGGDGRSRGAATAVLEREASGGEAWQTSSTEVVEPDSYSDPDSGQDIGISIGRSDGRQQVHEVAEQAEQPLQQQGWQQGEEREEGQEAVAFPFPVAFQDHWIETYVRVMWSCLTEVDQDKVPRPQDLYTVE